MSNGKGDSPRNCFTQAFRDNWDRIFRKEKASKVGKHTSKRTAEKKKKGPSNDDIRKD